MTSVCAVNSNIGMATYLSDTIKYQVFTIGQEFLNEDYKHSKHKCYTDDYIINWNAIKPTFSDCLGDNFNIQIFPIEWYSIKIRKLFPVYLDAQFHLKNIDIHNIEKSLKYLEWTHRLEDIKTFFSSSTINDLTYCLEGILLLSSIFERALGNVYLLKGNNVPFLLRDLLSTPELFSIFGKIPIIFTQILLGTPKSLNLRNLVWHGFPDNDELYPCYVSILVLVLNSFGYILFQKNILDKTLSMRPQMINLIEFSNTLLTHNKLLKLPNDLIIHNILQKSNYSKSQLKVLDVILKCYKSKQNGRFVLLFLPQFEHFMRKCFCDKNCMADRVKTAECDTLYITLDEIFEYKLNNSTMNAVYNVFSDNLLEFYHDLFTFLEGPRIRDKFSHGEINFKDVPDEFVNILLSLFLSFICNTFNKDDNYDIGFEYESFENYNSVFHANAILKYSILNLNQQLDVVAEYYNTTNTIDCSNITSLIKQVEDISKNLYPNLGSTIYEVLIQQKVPVLTRPRFEVPIIGLLSRIIKVTINANKSFREILSGKFELFQNKQLHSRQRNSYSRMSSFAPFLFKTFEMISYIVALYTLRIFNLEILNDEEFNSRYLKKVLQCIEKIESNVVLDKNHWDLIKALVEQVIINFDIN